MKIVNRLYIKVILIAIILIGAVVGLYIVNDIYQNKLQVQKVESNKIVNYLKEEIAILEDELKDTKKIVDIKPKEEKKPSIKKPKNNKIIDEKSISFEKNLLKLQKQNSQYLAKIEESKKQILKYKNDINTLSNKQYELNKIKEQELSSLKQKLKENAKQYKQEIMKNIHIQIINELEYAPYLPVEQLQTIIDKRFSLDNICFSICIYDTTNLNIDGIKISESKSQSIIKDGRLLELRFNDRK